MSEDVRVEILEDWADALSARASMRDTRYTVESASEILAKLDRANGGPLRTERQAEPRKTINGAMVARAMQRATKHGPAPNLYPQWHTEIAGALNEECAAIQGEDDPHVLDMDIGGRARDKEEFATDEPAPETSRP